MTETAHRGSVRSMQEPTCIHTRSHDHAIMQVQLGTLSEMLCGETVSKRERGRELSITWLCCFCCLNKLKDDSLGGRENVNSINSRL